MKTVVHPSDDKRKKGLNPDIDNFDENNEEDGAGGGGGTNDNDEANEMKHGGIKSTATLETTQMHSHASVPMDRSRQYNSYHLKYDGRLIFRRKHPFRIIWDTAGIVMLGLFMIIIPFQITNVFWNLTAMWAAFAVSSVIDVFFIVDMVCIFVFIYVFFCFWFGSVMFLHLCVGFGL